MEQNNPSFSTTSGIVDDKSDLPCSKRKDVLKCHICWEPPTDPVATSCGHVFCWPCIYQWFLNGPKPSLCPLCRHILKAHLNIIPLYSSRDSGAGPSDGSPIENVATSNSIPPRPNNLLVKATTSNAGVDSIALEASTQLASSPGFTLDITPNNVLTANGRPISELFQCVRDLETERADLQRQNNEYAARLSMAYELRMVDLRQMNEDVNAKVEMCEQIISLQRQLDRANSMLPPGWNDDSL
jgi:hypothetical protein